MWDALRNVVNEVKDLLGIEVPDLGIPTDLASGAGDALSGVQEAVTGAGDAVTSTVDGAAGAGEAFPGEVSGQVGAVTEAASGTTGTPAQNLTQIASDITGK